MGEVWGGNRVAGRRFRSRSRRWRWVGFACVLGVDRRDHERVLGMGLGTGREVGGCWVGSYRSLVVGCRTIDLRIGGLGLGAWKSRRSIVLRVGVGIVVWDHLRIVVEVVVDIRLK